MNERILVIGLGRLGLSLVENLVGKNIEVIAVDEDMDRVNEVKAIVPHCFQGDSTDLEFLKQIGADKVDQVMLCMGEDLESSILTITLLLELGVNHISARASNARNAKILKRVGAHDTFFVEYEMGKIMAARLARPSVKKEMELGYGLKLVDWVPPTWTHGKTLAELAFPTTYGVQVVALFNPDEPNKVDFPTSKTIIGKGSHCLLIGSDAAIEKLHHSNS
jgi:trk system potassium uptake protein TrkA